MVRGIYDAFKAYVGLPTTGGGAEKKPDVADNIKAKLGTSS